MCFYPKFSKIRIATQDIVCYKSTIIKTDCCISYFQKFEYKYNKKYSGKSKWILFLNWLLNFRIESEGYHSYVDDYEIPFIERVKCIIPKGSLYLINERDGEYCSTSIKILKPYWL